MHETVTVGLICPGNTCRSPMLMALLNDCAGVFVAWTRGIKTNKGDRCSGELIEAALLYGLSEDSLTKLMDHRSRDISRKMQPVDLAIWLTGKDEKWFMDGYREPRIERIPKICSKVSRRFELIECEDMLWHDADLATSPEQKITAYGDKFKELEQHLQVNWDMFMGRNA